MISDRIVRRRDLYATGFYAFFGAIVLQNTVALACVSLGVDAPVSLFYLVKFVILGCIVILALTDSTSDIRKREKLALLIVVAITALAVAKGGGMGYVADELRFYLGPVALFLLGCVTAPFRKPKQLAGFVVVLGLAYVTLGVSYIVVDRQTLGAAGMESLFEQKLSEIGRSEAVYNGLPVNFYYFDGEGNVVNRAFGALFDPLGSAFFGATLFFYLWEMHKRRIVAGAGCLASAVAAIVVLTLTRSIIVGILVAVLWSIINKKGIAALPLWPVLLGGIAIGLLVVVHAETVVDVLDPSSVAHLNAYLKSDLTTSLLGARFDEGTPRGAESLYLTMFFECGVLGLSLFFAWFAQVYRRLKRRVMLPYARAGLQAMFVYMIASLTTEHWFIFSSSGLFWFLIGNSMTGSEEALG